MKYLCLGYHEDKRWSAMPESDRKALLDECAAYDELLRENGHSIDARALEGAAAATTLRFDGGKMSVTDGPFVETKEQLGGVMVLEATDLNHAIGLMSKLPCMRLGGCLEIRPINENI
ncbi:MAG: YciI family protein [Tepidisphaeraceae bacterium]